MKTVLLVVVGLLVLMGSSSIAQAEGQAVVTTGGGLAGVGAGVGVGLIVIGAGLGISRIAGSSVESIARQPDASGDIRGSMIITAALIEGVALFAAVICLMIQLNIVKVLK